MKMSHPLKEEGKSSRTVSPTILVIFGATGDLTARKLMPAVYNLGKEGMLGANFACVGFARREKSSEDFRNEMASAIDKFSRTKPIDQNFWQNFSEQLFYHQSEFDDDTGYQRLKELLEKLDRQFGTKQNRLFYLSVQPKFFPHIIEKLHKNGLIYSPDDHEKFSRVIIEKPFGHDLTSANELQEHISHYLSENQIYRIDHYLGKETVQNLLVFRFANSIFEALWNNRHIDHVQITVAEDIGIGTRGNFYEEEGLVRDVMQNHMMQLLSLVAMEPPVNLSAESIRGEKVKVIEAIRPFKEEDFQNSAVRGQYDAGFVDGEKTEAYRKEKNVDPNSNIPTFAAIRLFIDNWRWADVPFYLRGGKRMPKRATEIAIIFKDAPGVLFKKKEKKNEPNTLVIRIQPDEGISMKINCKVPGPESPIQPVNMDFRYGSYFGKSPPEAYERLIWDAILGDSTLFARTDEVIGSWEFFTPLLDFWNTNPPKDFPNYKGGSWGPADELMKRDGREWRII